MKRRWKSILYRRPNPNTYVLVAMEGGLVCSTFYSEMEDLINKDGEFEPVWWREKYGKYSWRFKHARDYGYRVLYWMELPDAPGNAKQQLQPD